MNKKAFTLAETLITLGIIGVVAALTLPTVIQKYKEKQTVTQLKKIYSALSQSYLYAINQYGQPNEWTTEKTPEQIDLFFDNLTSNMKILKKCNASTEGCWAEHSALVGEAYNSTAFNHSKLITEDGTAITFYLNSPECQYLAWRADIKDHKITNICGGVQVDINGYKNPNKFGKDTFIFFATQTGIVAAGGINDESEFNFKNNCNTNAKGTNQGQSGLGCTAWVLYNENMDYLHCNDLSWDGKKTCK